jgi:hypothetical protein
VIRGAQDLRHLQRADVRAARQSRAIVDIDIAQVETAFLGPIGDGCRAFLQRSRFAIALFAHRQKQMTRHQIAAVLIGEPYDLRQAQGFVAKKKFGVRRRNSRAHLAGEFTARLTPKLDKRSERVGGWFQQNSRERSFRAMRR